jgi:hypothetical protein
MMDCKAAPTPAAVGAVLTKADAPSTDAEKGEMTSIPYRSAVGGLLYLALGTRPDIAAAVVAVSRFNANPGPTHWTAVKRVLRYLKGTQELGITYSRSETPELVGYADSDWGGDVDTRRSTTGYVFHLSNGPVSWQSKLQKTVALSSCEGEYMAASAATQEAVWCRALLDELPIGAGPAKPATTIYGDNQGCIALAKNDVHHQRTKHIAIRHHFVRERVASGDVVLVWVPTGKMVADVLTKATTQAVFELHRSKLLGDGASVRHSA